MKKRFINVTKRSTRILAALSVFAWQLMAPVAASATQHTPPPEHKVTICHRTNSVNNPYNKISVDFDATTGALKDNGQGDHTIHTGAIFDPNNSYPPPHNGDQWGDIIPSYTWDNGTYLGYNYSSAGQQLIRNNCSFPKGDLKVYKRVDADGNGTYEGYSNTGNSLGFRWGVDEETPARDFATEASNLVAGIHQVSENSVDGYEFAGWYYNGENGRSCSNPNGATLPASVTVSKDDTSITLCNQKEKEKKGSITIVKDTQPNDSQNFDFTTTGQGLSSFTLDDDGSNNNPHSNNKKFENLVGGNYSVTEVQKIDGWKLDSITCSDGTVYQVDKSTVNIVLSAGQNVTCTFINKEMAKKGKITIHKDADPHTDGSEVFTFNTNIDDTPSFQLDDEPGAGNNNVPEQKSFTLPKGVYTFTEEELSGWKLKDIVCNKDAGAEIKDNTVTINLEAGKEVYCNFTNKKLGKIWGHKFEDRDSDGKWDEGEKTLKGWTVNLYKVCAEDNNLDISVLNTQSIIEDGCYAPIKTTTTNWKGAYYFGDLQPGTYRVCEVQQSPQWTQTYPISEDGCYTFKICKPGQTEIADFGNHHNVDLTITKSNDKPTPVSTGTTVTYTITVSVPEDSDTVYDAKVVDILPDGFEYVPGSWTSTSPATVGPTTYTPQGEWLLGNLEPGQTVTLTYQAKISNNVTPGTYTNFAFAQGYETKGCVENEEEVLLRTESQYCQKECNIVNTEFVSSDVTVFAPAVLGEYTAGKVLGATLVNTGEPLMWLQYTLPSAMLVVTILLRSASRSESKKGAK